MAFQLGAIPWVAVLAAAVSSMAVGALWFSPVLFGKAWLAGTDLTNERIAAAGPRAYIVASVAGIVAAIVLAAVFSAAGVAGWGAGLGAGILLGAGLVAAFLVTVQAFELRPVSLLLIDGGYVVVTVGVMGAIVGGLS